MDFARATDVAARLGQGMALLFGIVGLLLNPILLFIAFFVWMGAQHEASLVRLRSALRGIPIRSAMITDFKTLSPQDSLSRAVELILAGFQHDFPVVGSTGPVGVLMRDDVVKGLASGGPDVPVEQAMTRKFATADPSEMLEGALGRLLESDGTSLVVLKDGQVLGLVTRENVGELVMLENAQRGGSAGRPWSR
jgi:CBS domain-containing protein